MSEFKVARLYAIIKWLVDADADSSWNHSDEGDEGDKLFFYGESPKMAPSEIPLDVARMMIQDGWHYFYDDINKEHTYVFSL